MCMFARIFQAPLAILLVFSAHRACSFRQQARVFGDSSGAHDFRGRPIKLGWAILCRGPCTQAMIDRMDVSLTKLAYITATPTKTYPGQFLLRTTFGWSKPDAAGDVEEKLKGPDVRVISRRYWSDQITNLAGSDVKGKSLSSGGVEALEKIVQIAAEIDKKSDEYFPELNSILWYGHAENEAMKHARLWKLQAEWDISSIRSFRKKRLMARKRRDEASRKRIEAIMESKFEDVRLIVDGARRNLSTQASRLTCQGKPIVLADARGELDIAREGHREESAENLNTIAELSVGIALSGLLVAADAGVPGLGTVLKASEQAVQMYQGVGKRLNQGFLRTKLGSAMQAVENKLEKVAAEAARVEARIAEKLSGDITAAVDSVTERLHSSVKGVTSTVVDTVTEELQGGVVEHLEESLKSDGIELKELVDGIKEAAKGATDAGVTEGLWTAAGFIPLVGPFVVMSRSMIELADVGRTQLQGHREYFAMKDPILRSLFYMRDCSLSVLLGSDAFKMSGSASVDFKAKIAALMEAMNTAHQSLGINEDLLERVHQQIWWFQTADQHESRVMDRLRTGKSKASIFPIPLGPDERHYLPEHSLNPTDWQSQVGDVIGAAWAEIQKLVRVYDKRVNMSKKPRNRLKKKKKTLAPQRRDGLSDDED